ncbi:zinc knuckle-domain-containing protein [Xylaria arbuscula]|nr:zinc knuckle-domain-containing protein [Xylaria arbuscula]
MYRRGPSKSTPASVQCQKCLKRGHYSYECKASSQERPYVPRPSRTQQLFNPKLVPKLASDTVNALQDKKGVADQELAKREAERARKQTSDQSDDDVDHEQSRRGRSPSYESVSTISTRGPSPSSPARRRASVSPHEPGRAVRSPSPLRRPLRGSFDSGRSYDSPSPQRHTGDMQSPGPRRQRTRSSSRDDSPQRDRLESYDQPGNHGRIDRRRRRNSNSPSRSPPPENTRRRFRSRTPPRYNDRSGSPPPERHDRGPRGAPRRNARERSLSPFSKRLALTQSMNAGR